MKRLSIEEIAKSLDSKDGSGYGDRYGLGYGSGGGYGYGGGVPGDGGGQESPEDIISKKPSRLMVMI